MAPNMTDIPRLLIAATQSGSGKTTITSGIIAAIRNRGLKVQAYKVGPDYIDPGYLSMASGRPVHNLDTWLTDKPVMARIFAETAGSADISVVEGVMGLYDGGRDGISSTAEIAKLLKLPVVLVIDAKSMGDSAAAIAMGFREYDHGVSIRGVILNRLGSENHRQIICAAMERIGMPVLGAVFRDDSISISERHLGLLPAEENQDKERISAITNAVERGIDIDALIKITRGLEPLEAGVRRGRTESVKTRIGVAKDEAFSFYYPESLAELERAGAELIFFSPLHDRELPDVDGLIFGGGFPEMFAAELSANAGIRGHISCAASGGMPIYAECGGFMYLTEEITDFSGKTFKMAQVIPASCKMNDRLRTVGYVEAAALRNTVLCSAGTIIRGHEFHFSSAEPCEGKDDFPWAFDFCKKRTGERYLSGYSSENVLASYLHLHFAGNPNLACGFAERCAEYGKNRLHRNT